MKRASRALVLVLAAVLAASCAPLGARAWSNGGYSADLENPDYGTHDWIADMALTLQTEDVSYLTGTYHTDYLVGTEAPDNPEFIGDSTHHHVYYYSSGALQEDDSAGRAEAMYDLALARLEAGDFSVAAYYIGAMTHYIADVGVFGHTMGAYTDWGTEVHHSDYEEAFEDRLDSLALPPGIVLGNMSAYDAALGLARDTTFGQGDIQTNVWMDANYDWADDTFEASAMASLHGAVSAVAAAVNHLLFEAAYEPPPEPEPEPEPELDPTAPSRPMSLEAYIDDGDVLLMWVPPSDNGGTPIVEYIVYRGNTTDDREVVATVSNLLLKWTDGSVEAGETYHYWVAARNSVGTSELSNEATATVPAADDADGDGYLLPAAVSAALAAIISAAALLLRRRSRGRTR